MWKYERWVLFEVLKWGEFCMRVRERVREEERAAGFFGGKNGETPNPHYED